MNALAIFLIFLKLGATSFGGPIAHLGYFRAEFVARRAWLDERAFADLVALCQFLPGPASSQVGIALGLLRGGLPGAFLAWLGFTLGTDKLIGLLRALTISDAGKADSKEDGDALEDHDRGHGRIWGRDSAEVVIEKEFNRLSKGEIGLSISDGKTIMACLQRLAVKQQCEAYGAP